MSPQVKPCGRPAMQDLQLSESSQELTKPTFSFPPIDRERRPIEMSPRSKEPTQDLQRSRSSQQPTKPIPTYAVQSKRKRIEMAPIKEESTQDLHLSRSSQQLTAVKRKRRPIEMSPRNKEGPHDLQLSRSSKQLTKSTFGPLVGRMNRRTDMSPSERFQLMMEKQAWDQEQKQARLEAVDRLTKFVKSSDRWAQYWNSISIDCFLTTSELCDIGRLPREEGVRECRRLIRVPVINEEIAIDLWKTLSKEAKSLDRESSESEDSDAEDADAENSDAESSDAPPIPEATQEIKKDTKPSRRALEPPLTRLALTEKVEKEDATVSRPVHVAQVGQMTVALAARHPPNSLVRHTVTKKRQRRTFLTRWSRGGRKQLPNDRGLSSQLPCIFCNGHYHCQAHNLNTVPTPRRESWESSSSLSSRSSWSSGTGLPIPDGNSPTSRTENIRSKFEAALSARKSKLGLRLRSFRTVIGDKLAQPRQWTSLDNVVSESVKTTLEKTIKEVGGSLAYGYAGTRTPETASLKSPMPSPMP